MFTFGETVDYFSNFFNGSSYGRVTLMDVFNLPTGVVVVLVTLMAIFMLWGGERLEKIFGGKDPSKAPKARYYGAGVLVVLALAVMVIGQPTTADRWARLAPEEQPLLAAREKQIEPGELLATFHDHKLNLVMLDVRAEKDYNLFHLLDAIHMPVDQIKDHIDEFHMEPANTVFVVMSNDETAATEAWKIMTAEAVPNVYILSGGINNWLATFAGEYEHEFCGGEKPQAGDDELRYEFTAALGSNCPAAYPEPEEFDLEYTPKIELERKRAPTSGGCG